MVSLFIQEHARARARAHACTCIHVHSQTLTINRSVVRMPEEKAVTYHYRVLRRPRVVAFSHANLHSLVQGGMVGGGGRGDRRQRARGKSENDVRK